ncbi:hypothetical protein CBM2592_B40096 [Cupriavidus taiwanensis]|nr:hypothetical protein CBM2592_B40096 [Cupriavidus taiwanensis]SOY70637.1 hypothetical protein CBM2588_B30097 [Cupriavidus taiwanensis]SOY95526.1 hypothetical protein CBM2591_B20097 [Cupriavidus taiwanensis]SOZ74317.1 hypothetical protein CBM2617_B60009 [Cupriavidus taiwanensis]SOZ88266.1 hypothetical protein CBM2618_B50010 [Cupriavidus taiwanensis]
MTSSNFSLLRHLKGVVDLDAKISDSSLDLSVSKQQLYCAQVLGAPVDQRCLRSAQRVCAIRRIIEADRSDPSMH